MTTSYFYTIVHKYLFFNVFLVLLLYLYVEKTCCLLLYLKEQMHYLGGAISTGLGYLACELFSLHGNDVLFELGKNLRKKKKKKTKLQVNQTKRRKKEDDKMTNSF